LTWLSPPCIYLNHNHQLVSNTNGAIMCLQQIIHRHFTSYCYITSPFSHNLATLVSYCSQRSKGFGSLLRPTIFLFLNMQFFFLNLQHCQLKVYSLKLHWRCWDSITFLQWQTISFFQKVVITIPDACKQGHLDTTWLLLIPWACK